MIQHFLFSVLGLPEILSGEKVSSVDMASMAMPRRPKSDGASRRARIMVLTKPRPRLVNRSPKTHIPPRTTFFERDSGEVGSIGLIRSIGSVG